MKIVKEFGCNLIYASKELRDNSDIVMGVVKDSQEAFWYVNEKLRNNEQILNEYSNHYIAIVAEFKKNIFKKVIDMLKIIVGR